MEERRERKRDIRETSYVRLYVDVKLGKLLQTDFQFLANLFLI